MSLLYRSSETIDYQMLDPREILNKRIVDIHLHKDGEGDELQIILEDGKQIEICMTDSGKIHVQSD
jgi:hypothetical protein